MRTILQFITIFSVVLLLGCGGFKTVEVTGTVTFNDAPLEGATVNFSPQVEGKGHPGYAITDAQGHYKLQTLLGKADAGTTPGEYLVTVIKKEKTRYISEAELRAGRGGTPAAPKSLIPEKYSKTETSGFTATVENKKTNVFDFALTGE